MRIISKSKYNAHTEPIFKEFGILKFEDLIKFESAKFYFKYCNSELPSYFSSFNLIPQGAIHHYNTRYNSNLRTIRTRTVFARNCLRHFLPDLINNLPINIIEKVNTHSFTGFSFYVKNVFISSYQTECTLMNCYVCLN